MKKIPALILMLTLIISVTPATAIAATGEDVVSVATEADMEPVISETFKNITPNIDAASSGLTSITIPDHVTHIERETFAECKRLANVIIPEGVTNIGEQAFRWCTRLTSITIPNSVVSIGDGAFDECKNLTSITIPDNVTDISDSAFAGCRGLADGSGHIIVCGVLYSNKSNEE